jgi:UDP-N-acetylglucosamine 2-epimerase (non-hydrolysing)
LSRHLSFRIDCVVGARPNFVKIAPVLRALANRPGLTARLIHTGQHYDPAMSGQFFDELNIPAPDINLDAGSGTATEQTARIMLRLEPVLREKRPDLLVVVGDVNSTLAATLTGAQLSVSVAHIEAGLRSFDRTMPEEMNRVVTDRLCDLLLASERSAVVNLLREGVEPGRIKLVGNVMIDTLKANLGRAVPARDTLAAAGASPAFLASAAQGFGFVTLHRPSNVDDPRQLGGLIGALADISHSISLVFAVHPRTRTMIASLGFEEILSGERILATPPLGYLSVIGLMREAKLVITDSGGIQDETTALGVPCLTVRDSTERPVTIEEGTNTLVGTSPPLLVGAARAILNSGGKKGRAPALWDGAAAERIADEIFAHLKREPAGISKSAAA